LKDLDDFSTRAAVQVLTRHKPDLTLIHLVNLDLAQHLSGRESEATRQALLHMDSLLGQIVDQVDLATTTIVVLGDHGFRDYTKVFHINALFARSGWLQEEQGQIFQWKAQAHPEGGLAAIYVKDRKLIPAVMAALTENAMDRYVVLDRKELDRLQAYPEACCAIEALPGYAFGSNLMGDLVTVLPTTRGNHGQRPLMSELHTGFLAVGPGIARGARLPVLNALDVAPTLAKILGLNWVVTEGKPIPIAPAR
ncbi:MAG: alkaline phosphatase family protein, partial [Bdellovibrionota bacterium]